MKLSLGGLVAVLALAEAAAAAVACSTGAPQLQQPSAEAAAPARNPQGRGGNQGGIGAVGLELTLPGGEHFSSLAYTLKNGHNTYSGSYNVTSAGTVSLVIGSVAADTGYSVSLSTTSDDGKVTCSFPAPGDPLASNITVVERTTTIVNVNMQCLNNQGTDSGSILLSAVQSNCPVWNTIVANPPNVVLGGLADVSASPDAGSTAIFPGATPVPAPVTAGQSVVIVGSATGPNQGALAFSWSANGGTLSSATGTLDPNGTTQPNGQSATNQTIFTCPPPSAGSGTYTVTLKVSDGPIPDGGGCDTNLTTGSVTVSCQCPFGMGCGDGTQICNAAGSCVPALFSVVVLTSGVSVDSHGTFLPVSIQKYNTSGAVVGSPTALPVAVNGAQQPVALMGNNITEGDLTTSPGGKYLVTTGWNVVPSGHVAASTVPVVARIDSSGNVDTSTMVSGVGLAGPPAVGAFTLPTLSVRSAVVAGDNPTSMGFWVSGVANDTTSGNTGGLWYVPFGTSGAATQLLSMPDDNAASLVSARWMRIFGGQLYGGFDQLSPYIATIGTGLQTSGTPALTTLPGGFATWSDAGANPTPSPYGFLLFSLFGSGPDTLYIADDGINPIGGPDVADPRVSVSTRAGGLSKWSYTASTGWARQWNITAGNLPGDAGTLANAPIGFRGLAGFATGTKVTLMATTANDEGNPDSLAIIMVDNGTPTPPAANVLITTPVTQVFRGVALTPQ